MELSTMEKIINDTAYIRTGGSQEELQCAQYIQGVCAQMGLQAHLEDFPMDMADIHEAKLWCDGQEIPCVGYACAGNGTVEAPVFYLTNLDPWSLSQCKGKIVLSDKPMGYWTYKDIREAGALAFITYGGHIRYPDHDIDPRELRSYVSENKVIPGVHIHVSTAIDLVNQGIKTAKIVLNQTQYTGNSRNVVLDLPGESDETIVFTAHYDSTPTSVGAWDNMSGSVGLLALAEYFRDHPHYRTLRFIWAGSEERGLFGSKAYCEQHAQELEKIVLDINLDMIGSVMGNPVACAAAEEKLVHYLQYLALERGVALNAFSGVSSSDSAPFADHGVPAVTFAHGAPGNTAVFHNRYDTKENLNMAHLQEDVTFIAAFADRMANARVCPVGREIPETIKTKLDEYFNRKRPQ